MSDSGDGRDEGSSIANLESSDAGMVSPISAADMLARSRLRTPRRTTTPSRRLFPENVDELIPGMTPTSRNSRQRKSMQTSKMPLTSTPRPNLTSTIDSASTSTPASSSRRQVESTPVAPLVSENRPFVTPRATPGNRSLLRAAPRSVMGIKRSSSKRHRDSGESSSKKQKTSKFAGWGSGREESPMDLLRRLANAPGRLFSPTGDEDVSESISQQIRDDKHGSMRPPSLANRSSLKAGASVPGDITRPGDETDTVADSSSSNRRQENRFSVANTSFVASEAGQGRRAARQSQADNIFSDLMDRDTSGISTKRLDTFPSSAGPLFGDIEEDGSGLALDAEEDGYENETEQEGRLANESTRLEGGQDTSAAYSLRRFEDIERSVISEQGRDTLDQIESSIRDETNESRLSSGPLEGREREEKEGQEVRGGESVNMDESTNNYDFPADDVGQSDEEERNRTFNATDKQMERQEAKFAREVAEEEKEEEESEDESLDERKEIRAARLALLRKRRTKKKANRYSALSGNLVPALPSTLVKGLFTTFTAPKVGIELPHSSNTKSKIKIENAAVEAVEDLSHHFFSQLTQSLVLQAEQSGKKSINEKDIVSLMKSQGQISARNSLPFLARRFLPRELSDLVTSTTESDALGKRKLPKKPARGKAVMEEETIEEEEGEESNYN